MRRPGADPAQGQPFGAQVELEHPVVARRLRVEERPDATRDSPPAPAGRRRAARVEIAARAGPRASSSPRTCARISSLSSATRNSCIAPMTYGCELNVPRAKQTSAGRSSRKRFMRSLAAAEHADGQAAAERLAVGDHVRAHAEVFLRAAGARRKPTNTSSKISTMPRSVQTSRSFCEPFAIGGAIEVRAARRCRAASSRSARWRSDAAPAADSRARRRCRAACAARAATRRSCPSACRFRAPVSGLPTPGCTSPHQP